MKRKIMVSGLVGVMSLGVIAVISFGEVQGAEPVIEKVGVRYGTERPFSFYYPYNYQYYTPSKRYNSSKGYYGSGSCYWRYTNGSYLYYCH
jgi:hypothetical protein